MLVKIWGYFYEKKSTSMHAIIIKNARSLLQ